MPIKIIDLTAETAPSDDDYLIIRDNATGTTRKVTRTALFLNPPIPSGAITQAMLGLGVVAKANLAADAKISVRTQSIVSTATITTDFDNYEVVDVTALATNLTFGATTGTPVNCQGFMYRIKDNGTARTITWGAAFRPIGVTLPLATVAGKVLYITGRWNAGAAKVDILAIGREA